MYPSELQYKQAVENSFYPPDNGGYNFSPFIENEEIVYSPGNRAIVFKVIDDNTGSRKALKFFTVENLERFKKFTEISDYFKNFNSNYFVDFQFVQGLLYVNIDGQEQNDNYFPGLIMDWAEGVTMGTALQRFCAEGNKASLYKIAENFKALSEFILSNRFAHGDLKPDNIIVNESLQLVLVDYDGVFVPALQGTITHETGTASFQHPARNINDFNEDIDHFSILSIYISLLAIAEEPAIYQKYYDQQNLLFKLEDFIDPQNSELFKKLEKSKAVEMLVYYLNKSLASKSIYITGLFDLINGRLPEPQIEISHSPSELVIGQPFTVTWSTINVEKLSLNGESYPISGHLDGVAEKNQTLVFLMESPFEKVVKKYTISAIPAPSLTLLKVNSADLKYDEPLIINWEAENTKKIIFSYNDHEIDVTNEKEYIIPNLRKDTLIHFTLQAIVGQHIERTELMIRVYFPVKLNVRQERNISFINRPVKILIEADNADLVLFKPGNIDLTEKKQYEIRTGEPLQYEITASNKRYSESFISFIDVIKPPSYNRKIITIPRVEINIPNLSFSLPRMRSEMQALHRPNKGELKFNKLLAMFNIFKISLKRQKP